MHKAAVFNSDATMIPKIPHIKVGHYHSQEPFLCTLLLLKLWFSEQYMYTFSLLEIYTINTITHTNIFIAGLGNIIQHDLLHH